MEEIKVKQIRKAIRQRTAEEKEGYCRTWEGSGLSLSAFCRREGLSVPTFHGWIARRKKVANSPSASIKFSSIPIQPSAPEEHQTLEVKFPNGLQCRFSRVTNARQICDIIRGLHYDAAD